MKIRFLTALIIAFIIMSLGATALAGTGLPPYSSRLMTDAEMEWFFTNMNTSYVPAEVAAKVTELYNVLDDLQNKDEILFAMMFQAAQTEAEAEASGYADYYADFTLTATKDTWIVPLGNYGSYGTIPLPPVEIKAGQELRIMSDVFGMSFTYMDVIRLVGTFYCAAIPVTQEVLDAWAEVGGDPSLLENCYPAEANSHFSLGLNLSENADGTGDSHVLGTAETFAYMPASETPATGDGFKPMLWACLLGLSAASMLVLRKRYA